MSEIEKMKRYISRTEMPTELNLSYQMSVSEMLGLARAAKDTPVDIVMLAFKYGQAKGYRAAKAERG